MLTQSASASGRFLRLDTSDSELRSARRKRRRSFARRKMSRLVQSRPNAQPKTKVSENANGIDGCTVPNARSSETTPGVLLGNLSISRKISTVYDFHENLVSRLIPAEKQLGAGTGKTSFLWGIRGCY